MENSTIEEDEQVIQCLEELDDIFTHIKNNFKLIKSEISKFRNTSKNISENVRPFARMFGNEASGLRVSGLRKDIKPPKSGYVDDFHDSTAKNTFIESNTESIKERSYNATEESTSNIISMNKTMLGETTNTYSTGEENESIIVPFDPELLPDLFSDEPLIQKLYDYISKKKLATLQQIFEDFQDVENEKIEIFLGLLANRNFIRRKKNTFTTI